MRVLYVNRLVTVHRLHCSREGLALTFPRAQDSGLRSPNHAAIIFRQGCDLDVPFDCEVL